MYFCLCLCTLDCIGIYGVWKRVVNHREQFTGVHGIHSVGGGN